MEAPVTEQALRVLEEYFAVQLLDTLNRLGTTRTAADEKLRQAVSAYLMALGHEKGHL
jgi:hypothetical protein